MNYFDLLKILGVENNAISSNEVIINSEVFNLNIQELMYEVYKNGNIIIKNAEVVSNEEAKQNIRITGSATFLHIKRLRLIAEFWLDKESN